MEHNTSQLTQPPKLLSVPECAEALGVSTWTVRRLLKRGELPTVRIGSRTLVKASDVASFIAKKTTSVVEHSTASGFAAEPDTR